MARGKGTGLGDLALGIARGMDVGVSSSSSSSNQGDPNIIEFIESPWGLNSTGRVKPFPVQRVILKAFYGIPLDDKDKDRVVISDWRRKRFRSFSEADYLKWMYDEGRCNIREVEPGVVRSKLVLPIGRRSGKTEIAGWIGAYETAMLLRKQNPQAYYGIGQGEEIKICSVATGKDQAAILYSKVRSHFLGCQRYHPYRANMTNTYTRFQTQYDIDTYGRYDPNASDRLATVHVTFYSCVAKGLRGAGNIVIILDEVAHFTNKGGSSAEEVYRAVGPSRASFEPKDPNDPHVSLAESDAKVILISSPLGRQGWFYKQFRTGFHNPDNVLCFQAPTWMVNPTISANFFETEYIDDPKSFYTEYGAEFDSRTLGWIENPPDLEACIDPKLRPLHHAPSKRPHYVGVDVGITKGGDGTAVAIVYITPDQKIVLAYMGWIRAGEGEYEDVQRLDFEDHIANWLLGLSRRFYFSEGLMDNAIGGVPLVQHLDKKGLKKIESKTFTPKERTEMFRNFKNMMYDQRLVLYDWEEPPKDWLDHHARSEWEGKLPDADHCGYIEELLELQEEKISRYVSKIEAPTGGGEDKHDDRADALVRAVWLATQHLGTAKYVSSGRNTSNRPTTVGTSPRVVAKRKPFMSGSHPSRMIPRGNRS